MPEIPRFPQEDDEVTIAKSPIPENIEEYARQWVAIREGSVIVASEIFKEVTNSKIFQETDILYRVPEPGDHFYQTAA